jgi:IQ motif/SEC7 domain-containing protein
MDRLGKGQTSVCGYSSPSQPALSSSYMTGQYMYSQNYAHGPYPQQYQQQGNYGQAQSYGPHVQAYGGQVIQSPYQQSCHKKSSMRNGDVMKRCRLQAA